MHHLIYVSTATKYLNTDDLLDILNSSVARNAAHNITGFLIYAESERSFIQVLEGDEADVDITFDRILKDHRHHEIVVLERSVIEERSFGAWSMGFKSLQHHLLMMIDGYSPVSNLRTLAKDGLALKVLTIFSKINNVTDF